MTCTSFLYNHPAYPACLTKSPKYATTAIVPSNIHIRAPPRLPKIGDLLFCCQEGLVLKPIRSPDTAIAIVVSTDDESSVIVPSIRKKEQKSKILRYLQEKHRQRTGYKLKIRNKEPNSGVVILKILTLT